MLIEETIQQNVYTFMNHYEYMPINESNQEWKKKVIPTNERRSIKSIFDIQKL